MAILKINEKHTAAAAITASVIFLCACVIFFLPVEIPHMITICTGILTIASLWLCPWQITMALLFSTLGDHMGSCNNFLGQMGFFAVGHVFYVIYFAGRYFRRVEPDRKLTEKAKGYLAMVVFCALALLCAAFFKIAPGAPAGIIRKLTLRTPIYGATALKGHFGVADKPWENTDLAETLKTLAN